MSFNLLLKLVRRVLVFSGPPKLLDAVEFAAAPDPQVSLFIKGDNAAELKLPGPIRPVMRQRREQVA